MQSTQNLGVKGPLGKAKPVGNGIGIVHIHVHLSVHQSTISWLNTFCHSKNPIPNQLCVLCKFLRIDSPPKLLKVLLWLRPLYTAKNLCPTVSHTVTVRPKRWGRSLLYCTTLILRIQSLSEMRTFSSPGYPV